MSSGSPIGSPVSSPVLPPKIHFYRRVLPKSCIPFSSDDGKNIFKESMISGHMECYFKLAAQFRTQDEPAFCGLSTIVMVLNALEIDPGRVWKGPWRWYHENMLDCCVPLEVIAQNGINFEQFLCIASCNSLNASALKMEEGAMSLEEFRIKVTEYSQRDDAFLILSYSRKVLNLTGDGHFSPVGGYHREKDLVLMLDTARFKYPPHWVPLTLLYDAMKAVDKETGKPRGMMIMSKKKQDQNLLLFRLANNMSLTAPEVFSPGVSHFITKWLNRLSQKVEEPLSLDDLASRTAANMIRALCSVGSGVHIITTQLDFDCPEDVAEQHKCLVFQLIHSLEKTTTFAKVSDFLKSVSPAWVKTMESVFAIGKACANPSCPDFCTLGCSHFISFLILSWPYSLSAEEGQTLAAQCDSMLKDDFPSESAVLEAEVKALKTQLHVLLSVFMKKTAGVGLCCKERCQKSNN